jgi:hypothetical protein
MNIIKKLRENKLNVFIALALLVVAFTVYKLRNLNANTDSDPDLTLLKNRLNVLESRLADLSLLNYNKLSQASIYYEILCCNPIKAISICSGTLVNYQSSTYILTSLHCVKKAENDLWINIPKTEDYALTFLGRVLVSINPTIDIPILNGSTSTIYN